MTVRTSIERYVVSIVPAALMYHEQHLLSGMWCPQPRARYYVNIAAGEARSDSRANCGCWHRPRRVVLPRGIRARSVDSQWQRWSCQVPCGRMPCHAVLPRAPHRRATVRPKPRAASWLGHAVFPRSPQTRECEYKTRLSCETGQACPRRAHHVSSLCYACC